MDDALLTPCDMYMHQDVIVTTLTKGKDVFFDVRAINHKKVTSFTKKEFKERFKVLGGKVYEKIQDETFLVNKRINIGKTHYADKGDIVAYSYSGKLFVVVRATSDCWKGAFGVTKKKEIFFLPKKVATKSH